MTDAIPIPDPRVEAPPARLRQLAAQCSAAKDWDAALANQICIALGWAWTEDRTGQPGWQGLYMRGHYLDVTHNLLNAEYVVPTAQSAALAPGRWWWSVETLGPSAHVAYENGGAGIVENTAVGHTPALALCAAALLCRAEVLELEEVLA